MNMYAQPSSQSSWRMIAAAVVVTIPALAVVWSSIAWWPSLPTELPSQWSGDEVVSSLPTALFICIAAGVSLGAAISGWHTALHSRSYDSPRRSFLISGSVAAVTASTWLISGSVIREPERDIGSAGLLALAALLYGLLPFALSGRSSRPEVDGELGMIEMKPTESLAWSRSQVAPTFAWATSASVVVAVVFGYVPMVAEGLSAPSAGVAIVTSLLALSFLSFARIRVTVDSRGVRARSAISGIRLIFVRLADVSSVQVSNVEPLRWGGWGYRMTSRGRGLILTGGPAIVVTLTNESQVVVTIAGAEEAAGVLSALQRKRGTDTGRSPS